MKTSDPRFLRALQHRTARVAIGPSAARGQGAGVVSSARDFVAALRLRPFGTSDRRLFARRLDRATAQLKAAMPRRTANWGAARKLLNIFLRNCLYNRYLSKGYGLSKAERYLEVPLDSITGARLREESLELPRWPGVKYLTPDVSDGYQAVAQFIARRRGIARVHLDTYWWGVRD